MKPPYSVLFLLAAAGSMSPSAMAQGLVSVSLPSTPLAGASSPGTPSPGALSPAPHGPIPGQFVVLLKESAAVPVIKQLKRNNNRLQQAKDNQPARDRNLNLIRQLNAKHKVRDSVVQHSFADVVVGYSALLTKAQVDSLKSDPLVSGVFQDFRSGVPQPAFFTVIRDEERNNTPNLVECSVASAGGPVVGTQKATWIWIVDTGIDLDHPDLNVQQSAPYAESFVGGDADDGYGHGTHVAGIAAARSNSIGPTGVSAGAVVVPIKVFDDDGYGAASDVLAGLDHVATYNLPNDVVNMSLTIPWGSSCATSSSARPTREAVANLGFAGTWVCIAAGNEADCDGASDNLPGCMNSYRVYTVGAVDCNGTCPASYGSWGPSVDWAAVGSSYSTYKDGGYALGTGTSMATPIVSGIIHARGAAPISAGTVSCCGASYRKPSISPLSTSRFDLDLELVRLDVANVRDLDGTEDLFGRFDFTNLAASAISLQTDSNFWTRAKADALHVGNGSMAVGTRIGLINNLTYDELRHVELQLGGELQDEEGAFGPRVFKCQECTEFSGSYGKRTVKFLEEPATLNSINALTANNTFQALRFGGDQFLELNYYESNNKNDGWVKVVWRVRVKPHP